jgi:mRNA-degrading endonuclease toxin of MazEF toxin-antitoxin module
MPVVVVAAITTKIKSFSFTVDLPQGQPLEEHSQILAFQVTTIDQSRLDGYLGALDAQQVVDLKNALRTAWGIQ